VLLANGDTAFVKALGVDLHGDSVELYRREAASMPRLASGLPVPRLIHAHDDGQWVALVYEAVDGRHPAVPWHAEELELVADALADLGAALRPTPWPDAPTFAALNRNVLATWRKLASAPPPDLDPWLRQCLDTLSVQEIDLLELVQGDTLLHGDIRSDNILLTPDRGVVFLDWGWTCNGAPWLDLVGFAMTANAEGADIDALVRRHPLTRHVDRRWIDAVLLAFCANYWWMSRLPGRDWFPGVRAHQRAHADATLRWLKDRSRPNRRC
jgi:Ser/Thr protein kinase RdoA (MazF antagonist)